MLKYLIIALTLICLCNGSAGAQVPPGDAEDFEDDSLYCNLAATDFWYISVVRLLKKPDLRWDSLLVRSGAAFPQGDSIELHHDISAGPPAIFPLATRRLAGGVENRAYFAFHRDIFYLSLTMLRDTIIAAGFTCGDRLIYSMIDSVRMGEAITEYARLYGITIALDDTFMLPLKMHLYSYYCGLDAGITIEYARLIRLVQANDRARLQRWLRCMKPELQAFGALGLLYLQSVGVEITQEDEAIIAMLKRSDMVIAGCKGCMFGTQELMKDALSDNEIRSMLLNIRGDVLEQR